MKKKYISKIFASTEAYCEELVILTKILFKYHNILIMLNYLMIYH